MKNLKNLDFKKLIANKMAAASAKGFVTIPVSKYQLTETHLMICNEFGKIIDSKLLSEITLNYSSINETHQVVVSYNKPFLMDSNNAFSKYL